MNVKFEPGWLQRTLDENCIQYMYYTNRRSNEKRDEALATPEQARKLAAMMRRRYKEWTGEDL